MKDYSMYIYFKGTEEYPNKKAEFFGFYESIFEYNYTGTPENKEEAFKEHITGVLYQQASDLYQFGYPGVDISASLEEYYKIYFNPDFKLEFYERED